MRTSNLWGRAPGPAESREGIPCASRVPLAEIPVVVDGSDSPEAEEPGDAQLYSLRIAMFVSETFDVLMACGSSAEVPLTVGLPV